MNIKKDFPFLKQKINNKPIVYFDNASTTQKPYQVINSITEFYTKYNSNIFRGIYSVTENSTKLYEEVRQKVATFINADFNEIVFTKNTTDSINTIALSWAKNYISKDDEIIVSGFEHHSNFIVWQQLAINKGAILKIIPINQNYELDLEVYSSLLTPKTKLVAISHVSNTFGTCNNIELITEKAHKMGAKVLIDAAQSVAHQLIDVKKIKCDFLVFSGHKMLAPMGVGIAYINKSMHNQITPYQFGGGMVYEVSNQKSSWLEMPYKLEAGTPSVADIIGLGIAIDYINNNIDFDQLKIYEAKLCEKIIEDLQLFPTFKILGPTQQLRINGHIINFTIENMHAHDIATYLDKYNIFVRAGHHCAQPAHKYLNIDSSVRISFYGYNTISEVDTFIKVIKKIL